MASPLEQFRINKLISIDVAGVDISFTNSSLWMVITAITAVTFFMVATSQRKIVPGPFQAFAENLFDTAGTIVSDNVGSGGKPFFPFVFSLFIFVLFGNLLGLVPGAFTFTSHIAVTGAMAVIIFTFITLLGIFKHGFKFFSLFFPSGAPIVSAPVLVPIEIVSYFSRPVSLAVRLFANMVAGHVLLKVIAGFVVSLGATYVLPGIVPFFAVVAITILEIMVAVIQAYVFAILTCVYLHDAIHLH
ncbi:MAG: F0F1 ATP synthase subunit A [Alphaproteobacteria bacterium]